MIAAAIAVVLWVGLVTYLAYLAAQGIAADLRDQKRRLRAAQNGHASAAVKESR